MIIAQHAHYTLFYCNLLLLTVSFCQTIANSRDDLLFPTQADKANASFFLKALPRFFSKIVLFVFLSDKSIRDTPVVHMRESFNALSVMHVKINHCVDKISLYRSSLRQYLPILLNSPFFRFFLPDTSITM